MIEHLTGVALESFSLLAKMGPYLLLGFLVAGAMHVLMPVGMVTKHLGGSGLGSVFRASILGVPLPLCSCGVVPVAAQLKNSGASNGAVVGFLVTTPTSGVDSILATYSLLGGAFMLIRVVASFLIGLGAGIATALGLGKRTSAASPMPPAASDRPRGNRLVQGLAYGFGNLLSDIARPLLIGTLLGGLIAWFLPPGVLEEYIGQGLLSYGVMLVVAIPLYVCASGSIPLAAALMAKGISPGAALIFLLAGPATNAATVSVVSKLLGRRALIIYLAFLVFGALGAGLVTDALFAGFPGWLPDFSGGPAQHMHGLSWFEIATGAFLGILSLVHIGKKLLARFSKPAAMAPNVACPHCAAAGKDND